MNIAIADRLLRLRKAHGFSQEELAEKIGISRQSVSKWERAEASPDTDNLIALARLYSVSLDELLLSDEEESKAGRGAPARSERAGKRRGRAARRPSLRNRMPGPSPDWTACRRWRCCRKGGTTMCGWLFPIRSS